MRYTIIQKYTGGEEYLDTCYDLTEAQDVARYFRTRKPGRIVIEEEVK